MRLKGFLNTNEVNLVIFTSKSETNDGGYFRTVDRLVEECKKRKINHYVAFIDSCFLTKENDTLKIYNNDDKKGTIIDKSNTVVLIRGGATTHKYGLDVISQIEKNGVFCINSRESIEICSDKYRTVLRLSDAGIVCPKTSLISNIESLDIAFKNMGGKLPIILKTITGSKGIGVFKADSYSGLVSTLQMIWKLNPEIEILLQEYLEAPYDIRIHVLNGKVISSMKRFKIKGDFRSNFSLGSKIEPIKITEEQEKIALDVAKAINCIWCGVDMMNDGKKNYIIEVNSSPGTKGIEEATKKNIVKEVLDFAINKENWIYKQKICGYIENVYIDELKMSVSAKMDTGNGSFSSIHADDWEVKGDKIIWNFDKKTKIKTDFIGYRDIEVGGFLRNVEKRPLTKLNMKFDGKEYEMTFALTDRDEKTTHALICRYFLKKAGYVVDPNSKYLIS